MWIEVFHLSVSISEYIPAAVWPPLSDPANIQFFLPYVANCVITHPTWYDSSTIFNFIVGSVFFPLISLYPFFHLKKGSYHFV